MDMSQRKSPSYCFVFVCQEGELTIQSLLLAASLKQFLRCDHELVAAVPGPVDRWGTPPVAALAMLRELGVRMVSITNPLDDDYPIGNKLACLDVETQADKVVFL